MSSNPPELKIKKMGRRKSSKAVAFGGLAFVRAIKGIVGYVRSTYHMMDSRCWWEHVNMKHRHAEIHCIKGVH